MTDAELQRTFSRMRLAVSLNSAMPATISLTGEEASALLAHIDHLRALGRTAAEAERHHAGANE